MMSHLTLNDLELGALATLIGERRTRNNHSRWDRAGITSALRHANHGDALVLLAAGYRAADDANAATPIALTWAQYQPAKTTGQTTGGTPINREAIRAEQRIRQQAIDRCGVCDDAGYLPGGWRCPHDNRTDTERATHVHQLAAAAKAQVQPLKTTGQDQEQP